jgi:hypothetical protein
VSCQARDDNPLHGPVHMAAMAQAAEQGGAVAIRANGADDIRAIRAATPLPVIGILKVFGAAPVIITPRPRLGARGDRGRRRHRGARLHRPPAAKATTGATSMALIA